MLIFLFFQQCLVSVLDFNVQPIAVVDLLNKLFFELFLQRPRLIQQKTYFRNPKRKLNYLWEVIFEEIIFKFLVVWRSYEFLMVFDHYKASRNNGFKLFMVEFSKPLSLFDYWDSFTLIFFQFRFLQNGWQEQKIIVLDLIYSLLQIIVDDILSFFY